MTTHQNVQRRVWRKSRGFVWGRAWRKSPCQRAATLAPRSRDWSKYSLSFGEIKSEHGPEVIIDKQ